MAEPLTRAQRRRAVSLVVWLTANTPLAPPRYERELLARFEAGEVTLDQLQAILASGVHRVLYHSPAVGRPTPAALRALLRVSRPHNAARGITGLLLYSDVLVERRDVPLPDRLDALCAAVAAGGDPEALLDDVLAALDPPDTDDVTLVGLGRT